MKAAQRRSVSAVSAFVTGAVLGAVLAGAVAAVADVPNTFLSGAVISSGQVNANFASLDARIDTLERLNLSSELASLRAQDTSLRNDISALQGINAEARLNALDAKGTSHDTAVSALQSQGTLHGNRLNTLEANSATHSAGIAGLQYSKSFVFVRGGNGFGSIGTRVRKFTPSSLVKEGTDIDYVPDLSSGDGDHFLIRRTGLYVISYTESGTGNANSGVFGPSRDGNSAVALSNHTIGTQILSVGYIGIMNPSNWGAGTVTVTFPLEENNKIRAHVDDPASFVAGSPATPQFCISRVR
jgi:hypothetical protein